LYKKIDGRIIEEITNIVGRKNIITDHNKMEDYSHDETPLTSIKKYPETVVIPGREEEISEILKLANRENIPVVARGGATGLCGGCVPLHGGILLSLERMNKILEIDRENLMATAQAGVTLRDFHSTLEKKKLFFPPHPGEDSATIGGIIATNAGGARAVKYGTVRNFVRSIKTVLPGGEIASLGGKLLKDSSGYNLLHLMTGSEGTLGIVTEATLSVLPLPALSQTLIIPFKDSSSALKSVPEILCSGLLPLAIEFISHEVINISRDYLNKSWPVKEGNMYLIIILEGEWEEELEKAAEKISEICLAYEAIDVFVAENRGKQAEILEIRSMVYEALKARTLEVLDIVIPKNQVEPHLKAIEEISERENIWLPTYGHAADGNLHTHITKCGNNRQLCDVAEEKYKKIRELIHKDAKERGGKVSGEHGIGILKKEYMPLFIEKPLLNIMKGIKKVFDPNNILNPGKIVD